jgi:predicted nuclease with TOPRIM domain
MRKTAKIENQLLEMIQPRIQLIENKFSNGEALSYQDVNTLLLKSAFNHMNHFELRLDEVAENMEQLRSDFCGIEGRIRKLEDRFLVLEDRFVVLEDRFVVIENRFLALESKFVVLENRFVVLEGKFQTLEVKFQLMEGKFHELEGRFIALERRFHELENRFYALEGKFQTLEARFVSFEAKIEATIEKTMKSHIKWTLGLMTFCLTLFKIIDLVVQN